jgi:UDP-N-acetylmuramate--alanine ligase
MNNTNILDTAKKFHFIGIGGSGMCPMAEIMLTKGYTITGSDIGESDTLDRIKSYGIKVYTTHAASNIDDTEAVVYSAAVKQDNPELVAAREKGIPTFERSVMLGMVTEKFPNTIAVSGTHGKTTTTGMITEILLSAGKDPSAIIGGKLPSIGGNGRAGSSENMVCEACEYVDTFLQLHPAISLILNIDSDHLDYFKNVDNIIKSFRQFAKQTTKRIIINGDNANARKAVEGLTHAEILTFGYGPSNDFYIADKNEENTACEDFSVMYHDKRLCKITLKVPGEHNMMNAMAAFAATYSMGIDVKYIKAALEKFSGVHRRFEILGKFDGVTVADDFAHHPTELKAVLTSAVRMGYHEIWAIFQPHTYSRTYLLLDEFAKVLKIPDHVIMTEILPVREENTYNIHTSDLEAKIPGSCHFETFEEIANYVIGKAAPNDLIITIGGGDIYKCANLIVKKYEEKEINKSKLPDEQ